MRNEAVIIIGSFLALVLIVVFLIMPALDSLAAERENLAVRKVQLEEVNLFNEKIKELMEKYASDPGGVEKILSVLPNGQEVPAVLRNLQGLAGANGLIMEKIEFNEISPSTEIAPPQIGQEEEILPKKGGFNEVSPTASLMAPKPAASYKILSASVKLSGSYGAFKNYLQALEKSERLIDVVYLSLTDNGLNPSTSSFSVNLYLYYQ